MDDTGGFSGVVRLSNVSDFIAPNLDCIIPLETKQQQVKEESLVNIKKKTEKCKETEGRDKKSIKISLADCLACNGCITSAETVLIEEQSIGKLWEGVRSSELSVITVSPQAICSIAVRMGIDASEAARRIAQFFLSQGVTHVIDSSFARLFTHSLLYDEFQSIASTSRPVLSSACPGFVCYAEKSPNATAAALVPQISRIRSPQAVAGALVKDYLSRKLAVAPDRIHHATVMPCFDKKLEASRKQFVVCTSHGEDVRETDCVVSTAELFDEMVRIGDNVEVEYAQPAGFLGDLSRGVMIGENGGSSGGYAENIVASFLRTNGGGDVRSMKLNKHMDSIEVRNANDVTCLRVARVYGFRNIQNLVRKMKTKKTTYDYVEIMACPGGCSNGGGQIRHDTIDEREKVLAKIDEMYEQLERIEVAKQIEEVANEWSSLNPDWQKLLLTDYTAVETNIAQTLKW